MLEEVIERALQRQLAPLKKHFDNQFLKLNQRLDRVEQCNVGDYAKKHVTAHAESFGKAFPLLPCNTLQEIEALNVVLGCTTTAVSAV